MSSKLPADRVAAARTRTAAVLTRLAPRSLAARLLTTATILVALVSIVVVGVTTLALRHFLIEQLDQQLSSASARNMSPPHALPNGQFLTGLPCAISQSGGGLFFGQPVGTIIGRFDSSCRSVVVVTYRGVSTIAESDLASLSRLSPSQGPRTVHLDQGTYRVIVAGPSDARVITGLPTASIDSTIDRVFLWELSVAIACVLLAAAVGQYVVGRQLAPLRRVAATATEVTELPLDSGVVGVTARVPEELTDTSTEVGQVGSALNAMLGHVEHALDARHESEQRVRQFVADASHELRTPLSTIMGYAELTRRTADNPATMTHAMGRIHAESGRMNALVNDLLLLARLDSGRPLDRDDVDVSLLLAETVNDARVVSPDHVWRLVLPDHELRVTGDRDRLHQVIANLLSNAIRHTPEGTTVAVSASSEGSGAARQLRIVIHDDGPGMPPALAGREFERFSRGDGSRTRDSGGTGLGLSIVRAIISAHGGSVQLASVPGDTNVVIALPMPDLG